MKRSRLLVLLGFIVGCELIVQLMKNPIIFPSIQLVLTELGHIIFSSSFISIVFTTLVRTLLTFLIIFIISLILGILSGYFK